MKLKGVELKGEYRIVYFNNHFRIFDENNNNIYYENLNGTWSKKKFDKNYNMIYFEDSGGYWSKREYDENNNMIYYEDSTGYIRDNRPKSVKQYTVLQLEKLLNQKIEIISEKE